jgi:tRNA U34 5-methylaminomethyl-2-thiouridine-forming methyltransferase MnmC
MERKIIYTKDGSHTVSIPERNVTYHSIHGAIQESKLVFIKEGLLYQLQRLSSVRLNIFEMGFGTGLNALLTLIEGEKFQQKIYYETADLFPLSSDEIKLLNYCEQLQRPDLQKTFEQLHNCEWEKEITINSNFHLKKTKDNLLNFETSETFELVYFDAFAPNAQPELWAKEIFEKMFSILKPAGTLVTYCSKGDVRRAMQSSGFTIEKLPGPPGKREMIRAAHPGVI